MFLLGRKSPSAICRLSPVQWTAHDRPSTFLRDRARKDTETTEEKEINGIIGYLFDENENAQRVTMAALTSVKQGEMLFKSNCVGCHRATINDPIPQNANTQMCSMMEPAVLAGATRRFTKDEFLNILETGPCYMPSFSYMKLEEKETLYAYLKTLEEKGEPEGKTMGQMCPMMK